MEATTTTQPATPIRRKRLDADTAIKAFAVLQAIDGVNVLILDLDVMTYEGIERKKGDRAYTLRIKSATPPALIARVRSEMDGLGLQVGFDGSGLTIE